MFYRNGKSFDRDGFGKFRRSPCCFSGEPKKPGQTISKGHKNYDLMLNLQLGIRYSIGKHASIVRVSIPKRNFGPGFHRKDRTKRHPLSRLSFGGRTIVLWCSANLPVIRRTADTNLAVTDAILSRLTASTKAS
ncbi:hypothetical protein L3X38_019096 [Prunus dulcis]|uniref:Uncharacterized protein n=1 Tax=Prunus dulcis TaxID=3755 RepID=A0AAD4WAJ2_PRUDU|nr:hypothetical protein L3X38_019096 [Prunus dulcis]